MSRSASVLVALFAAAVSFGPARAAGPPDLAARVQRIEDHQQIERLLMEYGRTLDERDFAAYSRLFADNGEWRGNLGTYRGPAAIEAAMQKSFDAATDIPKGTNFHVLTNAIIDIDGDHATAVSKWAFVRMTDNQPEFVMMGRYEDALVRERGAWKFLRRTALAATQPTGAEPVPAAGKAPAAPARK